MVWNELIMAYFMILLWYLLGALRKSLKRPAMKAMVLALRTLNFLNANRRSASHSTTASDLIFSRF
jgi:hypothetical protein